MNADLDDADVARVLAGDVEAFSGIVARWQGRLLALAHRLCRDRGRAEDMTQEAFVKIYRSLDRWSGESSFSTWMTSVALNTFRSHLRLRPWIGLELQEETAARVRADEPASEDERAELVRRAVAALPAKYRDALTLYYFGDRDLEETARVLRVPTGTLKARLARGRQLVERALENRSRASEKDHS
jgi:RNA polymerase sigma-70 factor (ECF subfamily)